MLTDQPERRTEAEAFYRTALEAGLDVAEWGLAVLNGATTLDDA